MKKQLMTLTALLGLSLMLFSCSDDTGTTPDPVEDVTYFNGNVETYVYDEYDLDTANTEVAGTRHQDSLTYEEETSKDGKTASEYNVQTNAEGSYSDDGSVFYSGETNKMYAHLSVFQSLFGNIKAEGFSLESLFDGAGDWFLIADAKASKSWTLFEGKQTFDLPSPAGSTETDVVITIANSVKESMVIDGETLSVDRYNLNVNIKTTLVLVGELNIDVKGAFWVAPNIGLVKSNVNSFTVPIADINVEGTESVLLKYKMKTQLEK